MNINATLLGQALAFGILIWFTLKFVWPPLLGAIEERRKAIAAGLAAAEKAEQSLKAASAKSDEELKVARSQSAEIIANANKQASQLIEQAKTSATVEAERIRAAAQGEAAREIAAARDSLRKQVGELAVLGASRILKREVNPQAHADIVGELAGQI